MKKRTLIAYVVVALCIVWMLVLAFAARELQMTVIPAVVIAAIAVAVAAHDEPLYELNELTRQGKAQDSKAA